MNTLVEGFTVRGFSLATLGLEGAMVQLPDGSRTSLEGVVEKSGKTIAESIEEILPDGASLIVPPEPAESPRN